MTTFTTETGFGYYTDADGRVVSKFDLPEGEHPLPEQAETAVEVENRDELKSVQISPYYRTDCDTLEELKEQKISEIEDAAKITLSKTDRHAVESHETGKSLPEDISKHREQVREILGEEKETIREMDSATEVYNHTVDYPSPPKR